jgi:DNA-binding transcriptional LysR family regulator
MHTMHVGHLDTMQIRLIAELADLRNVSMAAQRVGLSQSAASHALAKLRRQLGDPLFARAVKGIQLTPYGERVAIAARSALETLRTGLESNRAFDPRATDRRFNLYASDVGQMVLLPRLIEFLHKEAPRALVKALPIPLVNPGAALASGEVDVAFGFFDNLTSGFQQSFVFRERYVCAIRRNHPAFRRGMTVEAFAAAEHAIADSTGMAHAVIDRELAKHGIRRNVRLRVPGFHVLPMIVQQSNLLAVIPGRLAEAFEAHAGIKALSLPVPIPPFEIRVYWHERYQNDPPNCWFRRTLVTLFRK